MNGEKLEKSNSSSRDYRSQSVIDTFGSRILSNDDNVFDFNAWDHAEWTEDYINNAKNSVSMQAQNPVPLETIKELETNPQNYWNKFYERNNDKFFKNRKWLAQEFPEIFQYLIETAGQRTIVELGCGNGSTLFPILQENQNPNLKLIGLDYSSIAVDIIKANPLYQDPLVHADVWDVTGENLPELIKPKECDIVLAVFVLSAVSPQQLSTALHNIERLMKPGGLLLIRDYGQYDLTQIRFKKNRYLGENYYVRGDGTRVQFLTNERLEELLQGAGFQVIRNDVDKRLMVNRKTKVKMYRCWIQAKAKVKAS